MARILVADDEAKIVELVARYLEASGYSTIRARDGLRALEAARADPPDCAVLDIGMPGMDGLDLARELRRLDEALPIIFLSARSEEADRVIGLELGADDYVTKPFSPRELVARVKALLRRAGRASARPASAGILEVGSVRLDPTRRRVTVDGEPRELTAAQFSILALLMGEPGRVFSRSSLLEAASGTDFDGYERTVDAHIKNLRKALGDSGDRPRIVGTVRGVGYRLLEGGDEA